MLRQCEYIQILDSRRNDETFGEFEGNIQMRKNGYEDDCMTCIA